MTKNEKEIAIARFLRTEKGKDKLGKAIVEGMYSTAKKVGPNQILTQAILDSWSEGKTKDWWDKN
jgi:hypothetical protein